MKEITQERAEQIALAIIKQTWPNRGLDLSAGFYAKLRKLARQIWPAQTQDYHLVHFYARVLLPPTFEKFTGAKIDVQVHDNEGTGPNNDDRKIALALLKAEGVNLQGDFFQVHLVKLAQKTGIPVVELGDFFTQEIIPEAVSRLEGWKSCQVVIGCEYPTQGNSF